MSGFEILCYLLGVLCTVNVTNWPSKHVRNPNQVMTEEGTKCIKRFIIHFCTTSSSVFALVKNECETDCLPSLEKARQP